ncbi:MAG: nucleotidyltransferase domain-containing protein [Chloroflexi bacterium]|nr:nucleotidyltransferase domain-containing protein [Chloroflexota bacterium]
MPGRATSRQPWRWKVADKLAELCRRYQVRRLEVFGSALRKDFDRERSDIDLLVDFEPGSAHRTCRSSSAPDLDWPVN